MGLGNISRLANARTRSITAENVYGEKGRGGMADVSDTPQPEVVKIGQKWDGANKCARDLGRTWKGSANLLGSRYSYRAGGAGKGVLNHGW